MAQSRRHPRRAALGIGAAASFGALLYAAWASRAGQDASWDLQNYHDYVAYAFLHWRYQVDVGAGGFQSYLNPLPYLIPYVLRHTLPPLAAGLALAVLQSGVVVVAWLLSGALLPGGVRHSFAFRALATIVGSTGATVLSEVGTSFADLPLAIPVLGGLVLLLAADQPNNGNPRRAAWARLTGGILVGAATGLKLTNAVFAVGLLAASAIPRPRPLAAARTVATVGLGVGAGFLATGGAWAAYLWVTLGNPTFPAMNKLFRSASAADSDYADLRFLPAEWMDALSYPAKIAFGLHPTAEVPFAEPRFLLVFGVLLASALAGAARHWRGTADCAGPRPVRAAVFLVTSLVIWQCVFSIQRYAVALEIVSGVVAVTAVPSVLRGGTALPAALALAVAAVGATRPPDWWRRPWSEAFTAAVPATLATPATYVLVVHPIGYWASALPAASRFVTVSTSMGLAVGGTLRKRLLSALDSAPGGTIRVLGYDYPMDPAARDGLAEYGLVPAQPCYRMQSIWWVDTIVCSARHAGRRLRAAADLALGETVDFSSIGGGWIYLAQGWRNADPTGTAAQGMMSELVLQAAAAGRPLALDLTLVGTETQQAGGIRALLDGVETARWPMPSAARSDVQTVCLHPAGEAHSAMQSITMAPTEPAPGTFVLQRMLLREAQLGECRS